VLRGWDTSKTAGWFVARIQSTAPSAADLKKTPSANCVIKYPQSITKEKTLNNTSEAFELSANNHGVDQWWVLVKKL